MIEFPISPVLPELIDICRDWHLGQTSAMYSVLSTGTIYNADILRGLASELRQILRGAYADADQTSDVESALVWVENREEQLPDEDE